MARPIREEYPNAGYHVTARGNEKRAIYRDDIKFCSEFLTLPLFGYKILAAERALNTTLP